MTLTGPLATAGKKSYTESRSKNRPTRRRALKYDLVPAEDNFHRIDGFLMIPNSLFTDRPYRDLPGDGKLLYGRLLGLLRLSASDATGRWRCGGRPCVSISQTTAGKLLGCDRAKAARLFAALESCGLLQPAGERKTGRAHRYYLNLPRPREPNEKAV